MKKIALLFLMSILILGIQGCSKEETSMEEVELLDQDGLNPIESSVLERFSDSYCKVFVRYGTNTNAFDRMEFLIWARQNKFSTVFANTYTGCEFVEEWYVPCDELKLLFPPSKTGKTNVIDAEKVNSTPDGPGTMGFTVEFKIYNIKYDTCDQVPLYIPNL